METSIKCGDEVLSLCVVDEVKESKRFLIFCFGGSQTPSKERYGDWQIALAKEGINSVSFDYSGTGKSSGVFNKSSLEKRTKEALCVVRWVLNTYGENLTLYLQGESMGAPVALGVIHALPSRIRKLILMGPAAYSLSAYSLPFNEQFTNEIRKERSWVTSPTFDWLRDFSGDVLILTSENDDIVPKRNTRRIQTIFAYKKITVY